MKEIAVYLRRDRRGQVFGFVPGAQVGSGNKEVKVVLDRRATFEPTPFEGWYCQLTGRTRDGRLYFVLPVEKVKDREERKARERLRRIEAEQAALAAEAAAREKEHIDRLDPAFVAEVEAVLRTIEAGPTRTAPVAPEPPREPGPTELGSWDGVQVHLDPDLDPPVRVQVSWTQSSGVRGALSSEVSFSYAYETISEAAEAWKIPREVASEMEEKAAQAMEARAAYLAAKAEYESHLAAYEAARQAWLAEGANHVVDLHQRGWLCIREFGGRPWLWAATETGDLLPVLSKDGLQQALE